ncbi:MAG TPA: hypothetical protein VG318_15800 [Actinomycetota bacterium]|nr:hypothetical protein [Actinomycetota bacterium]
MPDRLELSAFEPHVGEAFAFQTEEGEKIELTLIEAEASPWQPSPETGLPPSFSLVFRGPPQRVLPQGTYSLSHSALDDLAIFMTPIAGSSEGVDYQAVFS